MILRLIYQYIEIISEMLSNQALRSSPHGFHGPKFIGQTGALWLQEEYNPAQTQRQIQHNIPESPVGEVACGRNNTRETSCGRNNARRSTSHPVLKRTWTWSCKGGEGVMINGRARLEARARRRKGCGARMLLHR